MQVNPSGAVLGDEGVDQVAEYVQIIGEPSAESHPGKAAYEQNCIAGAMPRSKLK